MTTVPENGDRACFVVPLGNGGSPPGVLEVEAPRLVLEGREDALRDTAAQIADLIEAVVPRRSAAPDDLDLSLAWIAHEVRGPILAVRAVLEHALGGGSSGNGSMHMDLLRRSIGELEQLHALVDALLASGVSEPSRRPTSVARIVRDAIASCTAEFGGRKVHLSAPTDARASVDASLFRSAVSNVLRNATIYSPPDTSVQVQVEEDDVRRVIVITVRDRGPGLGADPEMFEPFVRGEASCLAPAGRGLGLFIARTAMEAHGGGIRVLAGEEGTALQLWLPSDDGVAR